MATQQQFEDAVVAAADNAYDHLVGGDDVPPCFDVILKGVTCSDDGYCVYTQHFYEFVELEDGSYQLEDATVTRIAFNDDGKLVEFNSADLSIEDDSQ